ncbi:MAG: hypothetical protein Q9227_007685 [Pyrenula ochraceoflavens]
MARKPASFEPLVREITKSGGKAIGLSTDVSDASSVKASFDKLKSEMGGANLAAAVFNVGDNFVRKPFLELTEEEFTRAYNVEGRGAFNFSQAALSLLVAANNPTHPPTLLFTGATASIKGSANFASFASAKFSLRAMAQSVAREFGPKGVHVAHVIVDGVIDIPRTAGYQFNAPDAKLNPDSVSSAPNIVPASVFVSCVADLKSL